MKNIKPIMYLALALMASAPALIPGNLNAETAQEKKARFAKANSLYQQGLIATKEGNFDLAKLSFREVLKLYPNHPQARRQLIYISGNQSSLQVAMRKRELQGVKLPQVDFDKVTVQEAIETLSEMIKTQSKGKVAPNFIIQDPKGGFEGKLVTLKLGRIPAGTVLNYAMDQVGGLLRYDKHAIIIRPRSTTGGKAKTAKQKKEDLEKELLVE